MGANTKSTQIYEMNVVPTLMQLKMFQEINLDSGDKYQVINLALGDTLRVTSIENASTGYRTEPTMLGDCGMTMVKNEYTKPFRSYKDAVLNMVGQPGHRDFEFQITEQVPSGTRCQVGFTKVGPGQSLQGLAPDRTINVIIS